MSDICAITPRVKSKKGKLVNSKLFTDLQKVTYRRATSVDVYLRTKNPAFIKGWDSILDKDPNNEYTLKSLINKTDITKLVPIDNALEYLQKDLQVSNNLGNNVFEDSIANRQKLGEVAKQYNGTKYDQKFIATVATEEKNFLGNNVHLKLVPNTKSNRQKAKAHDANTTLNSALQKILTENGVSISALNSYEEKRNIAGVTEFKSAEDAIDNVKVAIRLAKGEKGIQALPEEFSHFAIEALGNNPLVNRLLNSINDEETLRRILKDSYNQYKNLYKNDHNKLLKEAAGKLVAEQLKKLNNTETEVTTIKAPNLLKRLMDAIKNLFNKISITDLDNAKKKADVYANTLATNILRGNLKNEIKLQNISETTSYFKTEKRVNTKKALYEQIINMEAKRLKIYKQSNVRASDTYIEKTSEKIKELEKALVENTVHAGMYTFIKDALEELKKQEAILLNFNDANNTIAIKASILRNTRNFIYAYSPIIDAIRADILEDTTENPFYDEDITKSINDTALLLNKLHLQYEKLAKPLFISFIEPFLGTEKAIVIPFGKNKGKRIKIVDLLESADKDISIWDSLLDSMANSNDRLLAIVDTIVKKTKSKARLETIQDIKEIKKLGYEAEQQGIKDFAWMFAENSKGEKTNQYINIVDKIAFLEAKQKFQDQLNEKYGKNAKGKDVKAKGREWYKWLKENTLNNDENVPIPSKYVSKQYLKETTAEGNNGDQELAKNKKNFLERYLAIKDRLESKLPENHRDTLRAILIRKDTVERIKESDSFKTGTKALWESIKDSVIRRSDDTETGNISTLIDFENRAVDSLPILYTSIKKGESYADISTDAISTLAAYADMANNFNNMKDIVDVMEIGRYYLRENRKITKTSGGKALVSHISEAGHNFKEKITVTGDSTNFMRKLNSFYTRQIYGHYIKDEGTLGNTNIDIAKGANTANKWTALNSLAVNILAGVNNVAVGTALMRMESISGEFFKYKDTLKADAIYMKALPAYMANIGDRIQTNKLYLWNEKFNVLQDQEASVKEVNFDRKTWFSRLCNTSLLFLLSSCGEHWMQTRTSLALGNSYEMRSPEGEIVSLYDAFEVVSLDPKNPKAGANLVIKKGYTTNQLIKDPVTGVSKYKEFDDNEVYKFSRKSAEINHTLHGIYNKEDSNAIQYYALGRMAYMFRKWIPAAINKRYGKLKYNYDTETWTEGYYRTSGRVFLKLLKEMQELQFAFGSVYNELTDEEKANVKRAITELGTFLTVASAIAIIDWDTNKDRPWADKFFEYQLRRLYTELGTTTPTPAAISEVFKILKTPAAAFTSGEKTLNLLGLLNPYNYTDEITSGNFKGSNTATKLFWNSPLVPFYSTIRRGVYVENVLPFYKQ